MKVVPALFIIVNILAICQALVQGFSIFATQMVFDSVSGILTKNEPINRAVLLIIGLGLVLILREIITGVYFYIHTFIEKKFFGEITKNIHDKMARIDPICMEDTKLHNDIEKASSGRGAVYFVYTMCVTLFSFYVPYFIFMGFYLHSLKPQFILATLFIFIPVFFAQFIRTGIITKFEDKASPIRREYGFYQSTIIDRAYFKETRILGAHSFFLARYFSQLKKLGKAEWIRSKHINIIELFIALVRVLGYAGILYMLVSALLVGEISVGAFAAIFASITTLFGRMDEVLNGLVGHVASSMGSAQNLIHFMNIPERGGAEWTPDVSKGIVVDNVSFLYPNSETESVKNASFRIKPCETIAIVGENGAGKTTLVRLMIGLYKPQEGKVILNGIDTSKANSESLYSRVSGVFQRFQRYQMTLNENIQISDVNNEIGTTESKLNQSINQAGVEINGTSFPKAGETMLSREFDGVDISGGEWQRVAIARGLYRLHDVIVLDEPTAAIDPIEESKIYKQFMEISKGKTSIIVTHRLGSTKIADRIIVMDKGCIVDIGSHYELMDKGGVYAEMYSAQAE